MKKLSSCCRFESKIVFFFQLVSIISFGGVIFWSFPISTTLVTIAYIFMMLLLPFLQNYFLQRKTYMPKLKEWEMG